MKLKEIIIYVSTILVNIFLGFLLSKIIFNNNEYFTLVTCGIIILFTIVDFIVATKLNYKLDIFAYNIEDMRYLILNSIFIGNLFSIPLSMFISLAL